jgi:antitoxin YefM
MLSEEDYEGLLETVHLLRSPANAARLLQSIQQAEANKFIAHEPIKPESSASDA